MGLGGGRWLTSKVEIANDTETRDIDKMIVKIKILVDQDENRCCYRKIKRKEGMSSFEVSNATTTRPYIDAFEIVT